MFAVDPSTLDTAADWIKIAIFGVGGAGGGVGIFFILRQLVITLWNATREELTRVRADNKDLRAELQTERNRADAERTKRIAAEKRADKAEDRMEDMASGRIPIGGTDG